MMTKEKNLDIMIRIRLFVATLFYALCILWHSLDVLCERTANKICGVDQDTVDRIKEMHRNEIHNRD